MFIPQLWQSFWQCSQAIVDNAIFLHRYMSHWDCQSPGCLMHSRLVALQFCTSAQWKFLAIREGWGPERTGDCSMNAGLPLYQLSDHTLSMRSFAFLARALIWWTEWEWAVHNSFIVTAQSWTRLLLCEVMQSITSPRKEQRPFHICMEQFVGLNFLYGCKSGANEFFLKLPRINVALYIGVQCLRGAELRTPHQFVYTLYRILHVLPLRIRAYVRGRKRRQSRLSYKVSMQTELFEPMEICLMSIVTYIVVVSSLFYR